MNDHPRVALTCIVNIEVQPKETWIRTAEKERAECGF